LKEEHTDQSSNRIAVTLAMSVSGDALLNSFQNTERKRKASVGPSTEERFKKNLQRIKFLFLLARRLVPFVRIQGVMFL
jgi:hypothetical protein